MQITLGWKNFSVKVEKVHAHFKQNLSSNYDGLVCDESSINVIFKDTISTEDASAVNAYWDTVSPSTFYPTQEEIISLKINEARIFGNEIIVKAAVENVAMGITQAGKTKDVADLFANLQYYLTTGSLYAGIAEINRILALGLDPSLAPFVTEERLISYRTQIENYLSS